MTDTQSGAPNTLPEDFDAKQQAWYKSVAGVFARVQKKDVADIPLDVWKKLIKSTYDDIDINPLYTRADELDEVAAPGVFPFIRGSYVSDASRAGWGVTETFGTHGTAADVNKLILHALNNGTTNVVLDLTGDLSADHLSTVLGDVYLDLVPLRLHAGTDTAAAATALYALIDAAGVAESTTVELGATPLTSRVDGSDTTSLDDAIALAVDAQEVGMALAAGVDYLRALTAAGLTPEQALKQLSFRFAATDEQFEEIAKFRAARGLWARIAEVVGAPEAGSAPQHAITAPVMFSQRDPWVNMLRCTVAAFGGGVGGASDVEVLPFDYVVPGGMPGTSRTFASRIARNTNLLLLEESHLGFVVDPAGGSFFVEDLTDKLADKAWAVFTEIESHGGFTAAVESGAIATALDASHERTRADIARRVKKLTGINEFPSLGEQPLSDDRRVEPRGIRRWAAEFEALRNRSDVYLAAKGTRPQAVLIPLGPLAKHNIRTGFATNLLASGGIEALNPGQVVPGTPEFDTAAQSAPIAVICGTDAEYGETGVEAVQALRKAGVETVLLAGSPASFEGAEAAPDDYLNLKIDAAATLAALLDKLGA